CATELKAEFGDHVIRLNRQGINLTASHVSFVHAGSAVSKIDGDTNRNEAIKTNDNPKRNFNLPLVKKLKPQQTARLIYYGGLKKPGRTMKPIRFKDTG
ncbi:MAG: hypothetical protein AAB425_11615, partial [Bdellovibrionota bacterium]